MTEKALLWENFGIGLVFLILGVALLIAVYTQYGIPKSSDASMFIPWLLIATGLLNLFGFLLSTL